MTSSFGKYNQITLFDNYNQKFKDKAICIDGYEFKFRSFCHEGLKCKQKKGDCQYKQNSKVPSLFFNHVNQNICLEPCNPFLDRIHFRDFIHPVMHENAKKWSDTELKCGIIMSFWEIYKNELKVLKPFIPSKYYDVLEITDSIPKQISSSSSSQILKIENQHINIQEIDILILEKNKENELIVSQDKSNLENDEDIELDELNINSVEINEETINDIEINNENIDDIEINEENIDIDINEENIDININEENDDYEKLNEENDNYEKLNEEDIDGIEINEEIILDKQINSVKKKIILLMQELTQLLMQ